MLEVQHQQQLLNNNWFAKLPQAYQQYIVQHAKYIEVAKDQAVFHSGDLFDGIYAVLNGAVRLGHVDIEGKEAVAYITKRYVLIAMLLKLLPDWIYTKVM